MLWRRPHLNHFVSEHFVTAAADINAVNTFLGALAELYSDLVHIHPKAVGFRDSKEKRYYGLCNNDPSEWDVLSTALQKVTTKNGKVVFWIEGAICSAVDVQAHCHTALLLADRANHNLAVFNPYSHLFHQTQEINDLAHPTLLRKFVRRVVGTRRDWTVYFKVGPQIPGESTCRNLCRDFLRDQSMWEDEYTEANGWKRLL